MSARSLGAGTPLPWGLAWRISLGQILAWGILYYAFTVMIGPMQASTGWSRTFINGGLSLGLLTWGICALPAGAWIQRHGGRGLMAASSALGGAALVLMGSWPHPVAYFVAWLLLGAAMAGLLYDSAFAVVAGAFGPQYRRGITLITLVGGLASTVFIPLAQAAVSHFGWQRALVLLGALHFAFGTPLHAFGIPRFLRPMSSQLATTVSPRHKLRSWWSELCRDISDPAFAGLALWFTAHAAAFTGLIFQIVPILQSLGVDSASILQAIAIIGPAQVLGRFLLTVRGDHFSTIRVGAWAMIGLTAALLVLLLSPPKMPWLVLFGAVYGVGNGVMTIVRGTAIAELFGRDRYAELNGALSAPAVLAKAAAPMVLALIWSVTDEPRVVIAVVLGFVLVGAAGLLMTSQAQRTAGRRRHFEHEDDEYAFAKVGHSSRQPS